MQQFFLKTICIVSAIGLFTEPLFATSGIETVDIPAKNIQTLTQKYLPFTYGSWNADTTIVTITDPECPFCIRHAQEVEPLLRANFSGSVNFLTIPVIGVNHKNTKKKGNALLCMGKYGGTDAYYSMLDTMERYGKNYTDTYPVTGLIRFQSLIAKPLMRRQYNACIRNNEMRSHLEAIDSALIGDWYSGTPTFIIVNTRTNASVRIAGAYPYETFVEAISRVHK